MQSRTIYRILFWLILFSFEIFIFTLPLFPTGDGPLHLYFTSILRALATHHLPLYEQFYSVRHLVQPYLFHYYALILLEAFFSPDLAEKILIGLILAGLAAGFRRLVTALSPSSPALPLCIFPFLLNWPLSIGALNYSLGLALLFFALATYYRLPQSTVHARRMVGFCGFLMLLVLAHPVPILLLILVILTDILLKLVGDRHRDGIWTLNRPQATAFFLACIALLLSILVADRSQVQNSLDDLRLHSYYLRYIVNGSRVRMFYIAGWVGHVYAFLLVLMLPASLVLVLCSGHVSRFRQGRLTSSERLVLFSVLFLAATLFAPESANGSHLFAMRLWLPCWLLATAAASGSIRGRTANAAVAVFSVGLAFWTLGLANAYLRPVARDQLALERAPIPSNASGLFIESDAGDSPILTHTTYSVNFWEGGRVFASHHDVLLNSPWLQLTIMPVKERENAGLMRDYTELKATEYPDQLSEYLQRHPEQRGRALAAADFILFVDPAPDNPDPLALAKSTLGIEGAGWRCAQQSFYAVCQKSRLPKTP
jgi:hypothetical protein